MASRLCVIGLAPSHPALQHNKVSRIAWTLSTQMGSGKRKRGAESLDPSSVLCEVVCDDGAVYPVRAVVGGKVQELNERLSSDIQLINEQVRKKQT